MTLPAGIRLRPGESILSVTCHRPETAHSDGDDEYVKDTMMMMMLQMMMVMVMVMVMMVMMVTI